MDTSIELGMGIDLDIGMGIGIDSGIGTDLDRDSCEDWHLLRVSYKSWNWSLTPSFYQESEMKTWHLRKPGGEETSDDEEYTAQLQRSQEEGHAQEQIPSSWPVKDSYWS